MKCEYIYITLQQLLRRCCCITNKKEEKALSCILEDIVPELNIYVEPESKLESQVSQEYIDNNIEDFCYIEMSDLSSEKYDSFNKNINGEDTTMIRDYV